MSEIYFNPWIGTQYQSSWNGVRTLVLGESHYEWEENQKLTPSLTIDCIEDQVSGSYTKQFWTNIVVAFLGHLPTLEEKRTFWQSVAFYNYIQETVGFGSRVRPTAAMWTKAEAPYSEVLELVRPQLMIVMGKTLWNSIPDLNGEYGPRIEGAPTPTTWIYPISKSENCLAFSLRHPSAGFSGRGLHPFVLKAHHAAKATTRPDLGPNSESTA